METNATSMASPRLMVGLEKKKRMENEWSTIYTSKQSLTRSDFPPHFTFGVATSAFQVTIATQMLCGFMGAFATPSRLVEGGWNEGGRAPSIWDAFCHIHGNIIDGSNAAIVVDQYHRYEEDIDLIAKWGFKAYRFSISWSRIFPDVMGTMINVEGISYYNNVIDGLISKGIEPYVTLYHWDLPLHLESMDGWLNEQIVFWFSSQRFLPAACWLLPWGYFTSPLTNSVP